MNMRKTFAILSFLLIFVGIFTNYSLLYAQQAPLITHFYLNRFVFNPAYVSTQSENQLHLMYRSQWAGLQGAPETMLLTYQHTLPTKNMGLGATIRRENLNLVAQTSALASYSYLINLKPEQKLSFGLSVGAMFSNINWDKVMLEDLIDPKLYSNNGQSSADGNFGVLYIYKNLQVGLGVQHLFARGASAKFDLGNAFLRYSNHSILNIAYKIKPKSGDFTFEPIFLYRFANNFPGQVDISVVTEWKEKAWLSVGYRNSYGYSLSAGFKIGEQIRASYAYEIANKNVGVASNGTHELMLSYSFGKKKTETPKETVEETKPDNQVLRRKELPERYQNLGVGQTVILPTLKFGHNSSELDIKDLHELDELAAMLKNNHQVHIEIGIHIDNTVEVAFAKTLSQKRAEAISKYLQKHGAKKYQIVVHGYGNSRPLAKNDDEINNNRVEIMMLKSE